MNEKNIVNNDEIKSYTLTELCEKDNTTIPTIKNGSIKRNYIKVRFENSKAKMQYKQWYQKKPYTIKYIRLKDLEKALEKHWWKIVFKSDKSSWQKLK